MLTRWLTDLDKLLAGWPDVILTLALLLLAATLVLIAFRGQARTKAIALVWVLFT